LNAITQVQDTMAEFDNKTCARLEVQEELHGLTVKKTLFVKSVWKPASSPPTSFSLAISDGRQAWTFEGVLFPLPAPSHEAPHC